MQPQANIRRSVFDRSHVYKTAFDEGKLIPFFVDEVIPGDTFKLSFTSFCRLATPICPFMDNLYFETFWFFVPYRLVWDNWVRMCGEQDNPEDSTDFTVPLFSFIGSGVNSIGTLYDYFGLGTFDFASSSSSSLRKLVSALPFRAYWLIWNEWFRDENLQKSVKVSKGDTNIILDSMGEGTANPNYGFPSGISNSYECAPRGKRYDYFTGCLPWPQKGPGVELPLGTIANVESNGEPFQLTTQANYVPSGADTTKNFSLVGSALGHSDELIYHQISSPVWKNVTTSGLPNNSGGSSTSSGSLKLDPFYYANGLQVNLQSATAITINSLRQAFMLQRYYEIDARGGTRYTEKIQAHFGVTNPDSRLQRSEFLGSTSSMFNISPIAQTSSTDSTSPQGNLAAIGVNGQTQFAFNKSFTEFGVIIGLCNVRADLTYQQGIDRMWSRSDVLDFYWPSFAHLGEQAVFNKEIYAQGSDEDDEVFGYQERYAEYRYKPSRITGAFRSTYNQTLDVWHLSQKFDSLPTLGDQFIQDHPPISRVVAVPSQPHFLLDVKFNLKCIRPLPVYGIPGNTPYL
ncbi:VP1 [Gokushovirus WZ-2015a]|nr:VP1 [Gokushovirus WZ-2015a]